jgi:hypothetical protein
MLRRQESICTDANLERLQKRKAMRLAAIAIGQASHQQGTNNRLLALIDDAGS